MVCTQQMLTIMSTIMNHSLWLCGSQQTGKFLKRREYQTTLPDPWQICMQVKMQQLELNMEQQTGSKLGKYDKAVYCHSVYLTYMQSISYGNARVDESQARIKIARRIINNLRYADDTILMTENKEGLMSLLMKVKEESEKAGLKLNI